MGRRCVFGRLEDSSGGRQIGWNIVTGYLESAARAMGLARQLEHDDRYDRAEEFLDVLYQLWEGSWEDGAVRGDRTARVYADPAKVHRIQHQGKYYAVDGYHLSEPSPQRTPVLFQAGASGRGRISRRAMRSAYSSRGRRRRHCALVAEVRSRARDAGCNPRDVKFFMGISVVVAPTEAEAHAKYAEYARHVSPEAGLAHYAASSGIDFSRYAPDETIRYRKTNAIESVLHNLTADGKERTTARILSEDLQLAHRGGTRPCRTGPRS